MNQIRLDVLLTQRGLASSRTAAQQMIAAGRVSVAVGGVCIPTPKASLKLWPDAELAVSSDPQDRYVSRGGLKLAGALAASGLNVAGWHCLDVGQSTGGFSDCLLQAGAAHIVGVDVGHGQLHSQLQADARVSCFEGVNARALDVQVLCAANGGHAFDLVVADVSFISLTLVLPSMVALLKQGGQLLCLVKPQFEVGPQGIARGGIVRDSGLYLGVEQKIGACLHELGLQRLGWFDSPISGGDGNHEFFVWAQR